MNSQTALLFLRAIVLNEVRTQTNHWKSQYPT